VLFSLTDQLGGRRLHVGSGERSHSGRRPFLTAGGAPANGTRSVSTSEQIEHYEQYGFVSGVRALDDAQVDALLAALARLADPTHPGNSLFYEFHSNESSNPATTLFHALARGALRKLFTTSCGTQHLQSGLSVARWRGAVLARPALLQAGASRRRRGLAPGLLVLDAHSTDVASHVLDRARRQYKENGCLWYVRAAIIASPAHHGACRDMHEIMTVLDEEQKAAFHPVPIELKRGYCTFHHPLLVHGSFENRSERQRAQPSSTSSATACAR